MPRVIARSVFLALLIGVSSSASAEGFADVSPGDESYEAITYAKAEGIANGFPDGFFRPWRWINRAEAVKMIGVARGVPPSATCGDAFTDVPADAWYRPYVCHAKQEEWLSGYEDGTFRPGGWISVGEAAALLARAFELPVEEQEDDAVWHMPVVRALGEKGAIPATIRSADERVSRAQMLEMFWRLMLKKTDAASADASVITAAQCVWRPVGDLPNVDEQEVERAWVGWINEERKKRGLVPFLIDKHLFRTASTWSNQAKAAGSITHKRAGQASYYDYNRMKNWFQEFGLSFDPNGGTAYTEAIGWGVFRCGAGDWTKNVINAMRTTFDFYLSEEGKASRPHFNAVVHPTFSRMGVGISLDSAAGKYYLTMHVGNERTDEPDAVCP